MCENSSAMARLPARYADASVRCVLPFCPVRGAFGMAFDVAGHPAPLRLAIPAEAVDFLLLALADYKRSRAGTQSAGSSLMPSVPGSTPQEGQCV